MTVDSFASRIIDALGGTNAVAALCKCGASAVAQWRRNGIPDARMMYLRAVRRKIVTAIERGEAPEPAKSPEPKKAPEPVDAGDSMSVF